MLKKVIQIVLMLCLLFSISVMAENENPISEENVPEVSQQIPQDVEERPQGGRGNMGMPPSDDRQGRTLPQNTDVEKNENVPQSTPKSHETTENEASTDEKNNHNIEENPQFEGRMPGGIQGGFPGNMQSNSGQTQEAEPMTFGSFVKTYSTPITSVILLALAFIFVIFYRRKNY